MLVRLCHTQNSVPLHHPVKATQRAILRFSLTYRGSH
jgi:hypothetical protein